MAWKCVEVRGGWKRGCDPFERGLAAELSCRPFRYRVQFGTDLPSRHTSFVGLFTDLGTGQEIRE